MALLLQHCRFLHTPKTGGTWVRAALKNSGIILAETETAHVEFDQCPGRGLFTIAFVRHPWTWWKSYWLYKRSHGWGFENRFDLRCMDNQFERFMLKVLEKTPGHCTNVFQRFVGQHDRQVDFVGAYENLVGDMVTALVLAGEPFDEQRLRHTKVRNAGDYAAFSTACSREICQRVLEAEHEAMARFNYGAEDLV